MPILRMETESVRNIGNQLQLASDSLSEQTQQLQQSIRFLSSSWQGSSRDNFVSEIEPLLRQMFNLADISSTLNQRLQHEVNEWERNDSKLSGIVDYTTSVPTTNTNGIQVPDSILDTIRGAEEQWQDDSILRQVTEGGQDTLASWFPGLVSEDGSIGRYNMEPATAKNALEWAFQNGVADDYGFSEMPSDEEIVNLIMNNNSDSSLAEIYLSQLKDMHPQLRQMSWEEISINPNYVAKLYSGYMGAGGEWEQWMSDLEPGSEAIRRLDLDGGSGSEAW